MKRITLAVAVVVALIAAAAASATSKPKLPTPRSTTIKSNLGVGGVRLGKRMRPWPRGWRHPSTCDVVQGTSGCIWTTRRDALDDRNGIRGAFVSVGGHKKVEGIIISAGDKKPNARPLRHWKTAKGIGFTSTRDEFLKAYPEATPTPVAGHYHITSGRRVTAFIFVNDRLRTIEMTKP